MPTPVGEVYSTFEVKGLQEALQALKAVAAQLDALNNKKVSLGANLGQTVANEAKSVKQSTDGIVKENERTVDSMRRTRNDAEKIDKAFTEAVAENAKRRAQSEEQSFKQSQAQLKSLASAAQLPWDAMNKVSTGVMAVGRAMEHVGQITAIFGYRMSLVAKPLADLGAAGAKAAIDLEASVTQAATQLDNLSSDNVKKFVSETTTEVRKLSTQLPQDAKDMSEAIYYIISTMTIDPDIAKKMIEPIAAFATAIHSTSMESTKSIVPILNSYKELAQSAEGVNKVLAIMNETIRRGSGSPADIARQVGDYIGAGKALGMSVAQQQAIFAALTRVAGSPSEAATQESALFTALSKSKTVDELAKVGIKVSDAVEGTGQWVTSLGVLDAASQKAYTGIISKLQGAEGVTGLYGQLNKAQVELARNEADYNAKKTTANARQLDDSRQKVAQIQQQVAFYEAQKAGLEGGEGALTYTGKMKYRDPFDIIGDVEAYLSTVESEQAANEWLNKALPNVRARRGATTLLKPGGVDEAQGWAQEMESPEAVDRLKTSTDMMAGTVEARLKMMQSNISKSMQELFDTFLKDKLLKALEYINQMIEAFNKASPELKEFVIQMVALATAAGPISLAFGTLMIGLAQFVTLLATIISPVGLIGVALAMKLLKEPLAALKQGVDDAGGGLKGLATFAAQVAVKLGLVKDTDAAKFLKDMGLSVDGIDMKKVAADADKFATKLKDVADNVGKVLDAVMGLAKLFSDNIEAIAGVIAFTTMISWTAKAELAFNALTASAGVAAGAQGIGAVGAAIGTLPATVVIGISVLVAAAAWKILDEVEARIRGLLPPDMQKEFDDKRFANLPAGVRAGMMAGAGLERWGADRNAALWQKDFPQGTGDYVPPNSGSMTYSEQGGGDFGGSGNYANNPWSGRQPAGASDWEEIYGPSPTVAASGGTKPPSTGPKPPPSPGGGPPPFGKTMTPQEMAPGIFAKFAGPGWAGDFASQHGGQDPFSFYQGQGYSDPMGAALRDKAWGDQFAKQNGRAATQGDWEQHWYENYGKSEVDELDAEGKPTGKKKTVIDKKGPVDEFAKMVEDAMKGLTDKKDELTKAYVDPAQALLDKKDDITKAYTDPVQALQDASQRVIDWLTTKFSPKAPAGTPPPTPPDTSGTLGDNTHGMHDFGGPVVTSGVYRLLKGEYVVSMPEQRDIRSLMHAAGSGGNRGGDAYSINVNGASGDPKAIAAAVMAELRWQKNRTSGKLVY